MDAYNVPKWLPVARRPQLALALRPEYRTSEYLRRFIEVIRVTVHGTRSRQIARAMIPMPILLDPAFLRQKMVLIGQADCGQRGEAAGVGAEAGSAFAVSFRV